MKPLKAYALIDRRDKIRGGDYHLSVYWTKRTATREMRTNYPECRVVEVIVSEVSPSGAREDGQG
jgi:hypothetical protein